MGTILKNGISYSGTSGGSGVSSYTELTEKPKINNVILTGNKTTADLNISYNDLTDKPSTPGVDTCYLTTDTAETALADGDYFPFQDVSASGKRKTLWSNIKSVLKTYFDSIYQKTLTAGNNITISSNTISASMPVMGTFSKGDLYDTSEKVIGKWTDGRPLYQRTYSGTIPSSDGTQALFSLPSSYCRVMYAEGCAFWDGTNYISIPFATESSSKADHAGLYTYNNTMYIDMTDTNSYFRGKSYYVTIRYIKTSDSTNSYNYSSENDYSTSEKIIGTWIGGQTLYQKTYSITTPSTAYSDTEMFSVSGMYIKSVDGVICWQGTSSTSIVPLSYAVGGGNASSISSSCMMYVASNKFCMKINDADCLSKTAYVTFKYTKS